MIALGLLGAFWAAVFAAMGETPADERGHEIFAGGMP